LFGADIEADASAITSALTEALGSFEFVLLPFGEQLSRLPIPHAIRFRRARARLDSTVYRLIAERRASGIDGGDLLSMLVFSHDTEGDGRGMTDVQLRDEAVTILLAGYETVSNALTWAWYLLSRHADAERRLHEEVDRVLAGRPATVDDVAQLRYARSVVAESLRLYPPAYLVGRMALKPYDVPGTRYVVPAGTTVFLCEHLLHRDPRFWDEPDRFDPDRWMGPAPPERHRFAYFPFGAGTRICIGEHFAWMEATLVLAMLAQRWRFQLVPGQRVVPDPIITLRAKNGISMTAFERTTAPMAAS
jgi:cytochrome P450